MGAIQSMFRLLALRAALFWLGCQVASVAATDCVMSPETIEGSPLRAKLEHVTTVYEDGVSGWLGARKTDGYSGCTRLIGSLIIGDKSCLSYGNRYITDLLWLSKVEVIVGDLVISCLSWLTDLSGLSKLREVRGSLIIWSNPTLNNLDALSSLRLIGGSLSIENNRKLTSVSGLRALEGIGGNRRSQSKDLMDVNDRILGDQPVVLAAARYVHKHWSQSATLGIVANPQLLELHELKGLKSLNSKCHLEGDDRVRRPWWYKTTSLWRVNPGPCSVEVLYNARLHMTATELQWLQGMTNGVGSCSVVGNKHNGDCAVECLDSIDELDSCEMTCFGGERARAALATGDQSADQSNAHSDGSHVEESPGWRFGDWNLIPSMPESWGIGDWSIGSWGLGSWDFGGWSAATDSAAGDWFRGNSNAESKWRPAVESTGMQVMMFLREIPFLRFMMGM